MMVFPSVPTPGVLGYEADAELVGAPFFVMEKIDGLIPTDTPSWATQGFIVDAEPAQRRALWEQTVRMMAEVHRLDREPFLFLRTGATDSGVGDCLDFWRRSLRWAEPEEPMPLVQECEEWLLANQPDVTALSWGDSRLPNVIYRDFTPVGLLDWDLVSLAGPQADVAWWMIMDPSETSETPSTRRTASRASGPTTSWSISGRTSPGNAPPTCTGTSCSVRTGWRRYL